MNSHRSSLASSTSSGTARTFVYPKQQLEPTHLSRMGKAEVHLTPSPVTDTRTDTRTHTRTHTHTHTHKNTQFFIFFLSREVSNSSGIRFIHLYYKENLY
jgi:hypothetical protein